MIRDVFLRTEFNYDLEAASVESGLKCLDDSLALQSAAEEADINTIVRRFGLTGQIPSGVVAPTYGDFEAISDFKTAMDVVAQANEAFDAMPAEVRFRFGNDPARLLTFLDDVANRDEAVRLGFVAKPLEVAPVVPGAAAVPVAPVVTAP